MAIQILPRNRSLGEMLGEGLEQGYHGYRQARSERLTRERERIPSNYWQGLGYSDSEAQFLSSLPTKEAVGLAKEYSPRSVLEAPVSPVSQRLESLAQPEKNMGRNDLLNSLLNPKPMGMDLNKSFSAQAAMQPRVPHQPSSLSQEVEKAPRLEEGGLFKQRLLTEQQQADRDLKVQKHIDSQNKKYLEGFSKAKENAIQAKRLSQEIKDLVESGQARSGLLGQVAGEWFPSEKTQEFIAKSNELAGTLLSQYGIPTAAKIKFAQSQKPSVNQDPATQYKLAEDIEKRSNRVLLQSDIQDQLIEENGGRQPANFERQVEKRFKEILDIAPEIPEGAKNGDIYEDEYGQQWVYHNGKMTKRR